MDAKKFWLHEFISEKRTFVIPVYQRNYDWKVENCEQLFGDIVHIIESKKPHFIGTFVYQETVGADIFRELIIIDGQQRITSIILIAKVLYDLEDDDDLREDIRSTFIKHSRGELKGKCKLRPTEYDSATFDKLMSDAAFAEKNFAAQEKSSAMYGNYCFFHKKISDSKFKPKDFFNAICKLNVVSILLEDENPQEIFESLNSTGLDLSPADLIRNSLLMPLDYARQEELYKTYWLKIEDLLRPSDNVENFIKQYLIAKRKSNAVMETQKQQLNKRNLYDAFKKYFAANFSDDAAETCLADMLRYAKFFRRLIFNDDTEFDKLSALDKKFYELVYLLDAVNAPIVLMYLLDRYDLKHFDEATFIKFVDALISFTFRIKVCRGSGITAQFAGNLIARLDDCKDDSLTEKIFWRAVTFGKGRSAFPKDSKFQEALVSETLYTTIKNDGCKYLLYSLERAARAKELPSYSEATVEHIMPQNLSDKWKDYLRGRKDSAAHEIWLHTLGNLTLTAYNSELGNGDFDAKKEIYAQSNFSCTRALTNYPEWTSVQIQRRAKTLSAEAVKIWTLPAEFNETLPSAGNIVTLDSDFKRLKGRKPVSVFIYNTEIKIGSWNPLLREIVRQLYALDPYNFRRAAQMENVRRNLFTVEPTDFKIDDDFYMKTDFDTETCLRIIKVLAENLDRLCGTELKEEIYFTLKPDTPQIEQPNLFA